MLGPRVVDRDVAERRDGRRRPRAHLDPVGHRRVLRAVQLVDTLDLDRARAGSVDLRAHRGEEQREVGDLWLARRVVDHRGAARKHRREQEVLGGGHARVVERDRRAVQRRRLGDEVAVLGVERGAHPLEPAHVQVDRPGADVVAAGQRDPRASASSEQRPEHHDRRAHLPHQLVGRLDTGDRRRVELGDPVGEPHRHPEVLEHLGHDGAVADPRDVRDDASARRQDRRGHQLERRVLRARDLDGAIQTCAAGDEEAIHRTMVPGPRCRTAQPASLIRALAFAISAWRPRRRLRSCDRRSSSSRRERPRRRSRARARRSRPRRRRASRPRVSRRGGTRRRRPRGSPRPRSASAAARSRAGPAAARARRGSRPRRRRRARSAPEPRRSRPRARA